MFQLVPLEEKDQNFAGATYRKLKFDGCLAPVAPVLTWPLHLCISWSGDGKEQNADTRRCGCVSRRDFVTKEEMG